FVIPFACAVTTLGLREIYVSVVEGRKIKGEMAHLLTFGPNADKVERGVKKVSRKYEEPTDA
ncbi:MAG: hypothetical protein J2P54_21305, partial [Bradyrhizobiaceae bacterium]|nr:hypothetical protein [Bradyrhizobiaceae bacterium]